LKRIPQQAAEPSEVIVGPVDIVLIDQRLQPTGCIEYEMRVELRLLAIQHGSVYIAPKAGKMGLASLLKIQFMYAQFLL